MASENWGKTFRELRELRNFSLSKVAGQVISKQQLSKFELGQSDITLQNLVAILENLGLSFEEYLSHVRNFEMLKEDELFERINFLEETGDWEALVKFYQNLKKRYKDTQKEQDLWYALGAKAVLAYHQSDYQLTEDEVSQLADYLFSILEWGNKEVMLFIYTFYFLSENLVYEFALELYHRTKFYQRNSDNKAKVIMAIRNSTQYFIAKEDKKRAFELLKIYRKLIENPVIDVYTRKEYKSVEGMYYLKLDDEVRGAEILEKLAVMYENLDYPKPAAYLRSIISENRHK